MRVSSEYFVCLIYCPTSTPDSKKCLRGMKIPMIVSKTFTSPPIILKIFRPEISVMVGISNDFDLLGIIEIQIYGFMLPIHASGQKVPNENVSLNSRRCKILVCRYHHRKARYLIDL